MTSLNLISDIISNSQVTRVLFQRPTVVPLESMQNFPGRVVKLSDSNHTDVCKPTDKEHQAYKELLNFFADILKSSKVHMSPTLLNVTLLRSSQFGTLGRGFLKRRTVQFAN